MSERNVETVRRLILAMEDEPDVVAWAATALEVLHPDIEMDTTRAPIPGMAGVYRGPNEVAEFWGEWLDAWEALGRTDPELIDAGDQVVSWTTHQEMRGKGSGVAIEMPEFGWVTTFRDQKIVRATFYMDKSEAFEAAGLSE